MGMSWPDILANDAVPEQVPRDAQNRGRRAAVSVYTDPNRTDGDRTFGDPGNTATLRFESKPRRPALNRPVNKARAVNATNRTECPKRRLARADVCPGRWQAGPCCRNGNDPSPGKCWDTRGTLVRRRLRTKWRLRLEARPAGSLASTLFELSPLPVANFGARSLGSGRTNVG